MKAFKTLIGLVLITVISTLQNCGLDVEETNTNFRWVSKGNKLTYDLNMGGSKIPDYRVLEIVEDPGLGEKMILNESISDIANDPNGTQLLLGLFSHVYRLNDGLHTSACFECDVNPCLSAKHYLKVPAKPINGQSIPTYLCADNILTHDIVVSIDSSISVPLGSFKTFVINDTLNRSIKFWNEEVGLIRVDNYSEGFASVVTLELSKKNY